MLAHADDSNISNMATRSLGRVIARIVATPPHAFDSEIAGMTALKLEFTFLVHGIQSLVHRVKSESPTSPD